jgi:xylitol oxidase
VSIGTNWAGHHEYRATTLHRPTSIDELRETVAEAPRIRALGSRHSFNDVADSDELVSLDGLPHHIDIDADSETVSFCPAMLYGDLGRVLHREGWALRNLASLPHISVAGSIATGTHGSGDNNGILARAVSGLELVTASGELRSVSPADPEFDGAVVSLGALGVVTRVTLDIEPTFDVRQDLYPDLSWTALLDNFDAIMSRGYSVSVFTTWAGETAGNVLMKSLVEAKRPPQKLYGAQISAETRHPLPGLPATHTTEQGGVAGAWIDRLSHFKLDYTPSHGDELQSEYIVPRQHAVEAIAAVRALSDRVTPHLLISELRSVAADSLWLSGAYETDAVGIHFTWKRNPEAVLALLPVIEDALAPFSARPHWGKLFTTVPRDLYPKLADFVALAREVDPEGKFRNDYLERNIFS